MKRKSNHLNCLFFLVAFALFTPYATAQTGQELFKKCKACHTIGGGKRKGPDLEGITNKRSEEWLIKFIQSSKSMINSGDPDAVAVSKEFDNSPMKDFKFTTDEMKKLLSFIDGDADGAGASEEKTVAAENKTEGGSSDLSSEELEALTKRIDSLIVTNSKESIQQGKNLFIGTAHFQNGGVACIACHSLTDQKVIDGGLLAKDLTKTFTPSGGHDGVNGIITDPPYPSMTETYLKHPITAEEAVLLQLYLQDIEKANAIALANSRWLLPQLAIKGLAIIIILVLAIWFKRKKRSVNYLIIKRQEKIFK